MFGHKTRASLIKGIIIGTAVGVVFGGVMSLHGKDKIDEIMKFARKGIKRSRAMLR